ncbi:MAG: hypothetical protein IJC88_00050 [Oscillospiraceae bacterium]|nr:hypothetical protein [Oscillospiraceae bacterium]
MIGLLKEIFLQVVISSLKVTFIISVLLLLTKPIEIRYRAGFRYYSWLAVMLIFLLPLYSIGIQYEIEIPRFQTEVREVWEQSAVPEKTDTVIQESNETVKCETPKPDSVFWLALLWMVGALLYFVIHIKRYRHFKKMIKRVSHPFSDSRVEAILAEEQVRLNVSKRLSVRVSPIADTPLLTGVFCMMLVLPSRDYSNDELHLILRHELIHYKRNDILYQCLTLVFLSLHWFNPFVYLMANAIEIDGETSCDEKVLENEPYETRVFYGEMLIKFLKTENQKKSYLTTTFFGGEQAMKKRLTLIASKKKRKKGAAAMVALTAMTILLSLTAAASTIEFVDSKEMVKNSSNRENTVVMDTGEGYDVFIGCEPVCESKEPVKIPLKSFLVFIDYKVISENEKTIVISNGNREIVLSTNSKTAMIDGTGVALTEAFECTDAGYYLSLEDIETLFSYQVSYDPEKNNVILSVTDETPEAVKNIAPPTVRPEDHIAPRKVTVLTQGNTPSVFIEGMFVTFPDAQPFIDEEGRTQIPIRILAEELNCQVTWNPHTQGITLISTDGVVITTKIGDDKLFVDGQKIQMDTTARIIGNRTYLPLRFLSEALRFNVFWET